MCWRKLCYGHWSRLTRDDRFPFLVAPMRLDMRPGGSGDHNVPPESGEYHRSDTATCRPRALVRRACLPPSPSLLGRWLLRCRQSRSAATAKDEAISTERTNYVISNAVAPAPFPLRRNYSQSGWPLDLLGVRRPGGVIGAVVVAAAARPPDSVAKARAAADNGR